MASNLAKAPILRAVATRGYASCGQAVPVGGVTNYEVKNTVLPNKLVVASADNKSPIARVSIVFRAGSRNETPENSGVAHVLRICAGNSTNNASQFAIIRNVQQVGASLTCSSTRETISYTLEGTRAAVEKVLPFLTEVATKQIFKPWEVNDNEPRLRLELSTRPLQFRAVDLLHKAAFRQGLGNSLFISKHQLGKISSETLQHYCNSNLVAGRAAVVGLGVDQRELVEYAQNLGLDSGEGTNIPSPYKGGEIRLSRLVLCSSALVEFARWLARLKVSASDPAMVGKTCSNPPRKFDYNRIAPKSDKGGDIAYVAIGGEGGALKNGQEALAFAVLQRALGVGPQVKWGWNDNGVLSKSVGSLNEQYAMGAINACYSDIGLFGVLIAAPSDVAGTVVKGAVSALKSGSISDADVTRGKNQLKTALLCEVESGSNAIEDLGLQAAILGNAQSGPQIAAAVDSVSVSDVNAALKKASKKLSIASVGNLRNVPFLDEIK